MKIIKTLNVNNIIYINPFEIKNTSFQISPTKYNYKPVIVDGDWDINQEEFVKRSSFFNSFMESEILKKIKWSESSYLDKNGKKYLKRKNKLKKQLDIYYDIKENGYKEIGDYITANIDRNGDFLFNDGQHRLTFAISLGLQKIPVKIFFIHKYYYEKNGISNLINKI